ncbi:unnamed protein product [Aureobasidium uvarum]|uniref:Chromo domain-containing protein n=1 Tax=Aureobasidium uvarum TaxID=2773716 RepID=A0A9N8PPT0_9PEZI|nr:unnamed protein product [Aureobasidium uvarum]
MTTDNAHFHTRLSRKAPINGETKIISRSSPSRGVVTYTLQIGVVSVPNVSITEVTDYVSAHALEIFENQKFEHDINEAEKRQKDLMAAKAYARKQNRILDADTASDSSSARARSVSGTPFSGAEHSRATVGGRQRPTYTHFYPKQRAPRGSLKTTTFTHNNGPYGTTESRGNGNHRDSKRRRMREDRAGSDVQSIYSVVSPDPPTQPPSAMEQAAGLISDARESDPMELDDESDCDVDMPIRQPTPSVSATADEVVRDDKGKGAASAFFTFRDHAMPPAPQPLSAKAKLVASLTARQVSTTPAKASMPSASTFSSVRPTETQNSSVNPARQAVVDLDDSDADSDSDESEVYIVEKILAHSLSDPRSHNKSVRGDKPVMLYQVKWEGYDDTTWEPEASFQDRDVLEQYLAQQEQKQKEKQKQKQKLVASSPKDT